MRKLKAGYAEWTAADDAMLREIYGKRLDMAEVIARVGHPRESIYKRAKILGVSRSNSPSMAGPNQLKALVMAARPEGVAGFEMGIRQTAASSAFSSLVKRGMLFRAALGVRTVRYFTTKKAADRWYEANFDAHQAKQHRAKAHRQGNGWDKDAPPIFTPQTKYTYAPPPPAVMYRTNTHAQ